MKWESEEREGEGEETKRSREKNTSPGSGMVQQFRVLGCTCRASTLGCVEVPAYKSVFPALEIGFLLSTQISYHQQSVLSDLSRNGWEGFWGLRWSGFPSTAHAHFLASSLHLLCAVLCLTKEGHQSLKSAACTSAWLPSPATSCFSSQHVIINNPSLLVPNNPWLAPELSFCRFLRQTHQPPYLLGLYIVHHSIVVFFIVRPNLNRQLAVYVHKTWFSSTS